MLSLQQGLSDLSPGTASKTSLLLLCHRHLQRAPKQETAPNQSPPAAIPVSEALP